MARIIFWKIIFNKVEDDMKYLITGGAGFIGSHFINHAHSQGHKILALRRSAESISRINLISD